MKRRKPGVSQIIANRWSKRYVCALIILTWKSLLRNIFKQFYYLFIAQVLHSGKWKRKIKEHISNIINIGTWNIWRRVNCGKHDIDWSWTHFILSFSDVFMGDGAFEGTSSSRIVGGIIHLTYAWPYTWCELFLTLAVFFIWRRLTVWRSYFKMIFDF